MLKLKHAEEIEKVKLGYYPYTYVRTVVMRALLFKKESYQKMLKMSFSEIAKILQESSYKKEISSLAAEHLGADLIELALNRNLAESFKKLIRISSYELGLLIKEYAKRKDIEDLKTIIRGKFTNADEKIIQNSITGAGTLNYDFLISLIKKESVEDILRNNQLVNFVFFKDALKDFSEKKNLAAIENTLDRHYYSHVIKFSGMLPKQGNLFKNFLLKEVEMLNLLTLLRLKKAKSSMESIKGFLILTGDKAKDAKILGLANLEGIDELSNALAKAYYKNIIANGIEAYKKTGSLIKLEIDLYKHLLRQSILSLHQHPLSIDTILGYMFAKEIEVRNLKIIIKGKQLGLSEEFIESQMVYDD